MKMFLFTIKNLVYKPLSSILSIILFGFGVAIITIILLTSSMLKKEITGTAQGIDLVVGAKGSPLQIILASVFHIDYPTGNISLADANKLSKNRLVASAIPISLGDSYQGYRIVGTSQAYADLYNASIENGEWFGSAMTAVVGNNVATFQNLNIGDEFASEHGLDAGGSVHGDNPFKVSGILKKSGTVLDNLILVSIHSVWDVHRSHGEEDHENESHHHEQEELVELSKLGISVTEEELESEEVTALLIDYRSPMAAVQLPRIVNGTSNLQAASPAFETARLFNLIGVGVDVVNILGIAIIIISAISVFISLINSLKERKYELAIMRSIGASRTRIFFLILFEGILLSTVGAFIGFGLAHGGYFLIISSLRELQADSLFFLKEELYILLSSFFIGIFASVIPAFIAFRTDISETLAKA